jgi:AcrR family transcriptional regulator
MSVDDTAHRIVLSALKLYLARGVRHSSLSDVAYEAGVTRITIYRYFGDKRGLVEAVCNHQAEIFLRAAAGTPGESSAEVDARLIRLCEELGGLPPGNLLGAIEEIHRLYPDVYERYRTIREESLDRIFDQAIAAASREHALREGIDLQVAKAMFWSSVIGLVENPALISANIPIAKICETVIAVFRHGTLKGGGRGEEAEGATAQGVEHASY